MARASLLELKSGDWGVLPKAGPFNLSGTWGGVMGDVINKKFDFSLSSWTWNLARYTIVQFVPFMKGVHMLVWTPKIPETDFGLFTRYVNSINSFTQNVFAMVMQQGCYFLITENKIHLLLISL